MRSIACKVVVISVAAAIGACAAVSTLAEPTDGAALATFDVGLVPAREIHVAPPPVGSDQAGDGSASRPFASLAVAATRAEPGTKICLAPGTHRGGIRLENLRGQPDAPIWIGGAAYDTDQPPQRPVIEDGASALHLSRCAHIIIEHLEIRGASANGINSDDGGERNDPTAAHHQVFRDLVIHDIGGTGNQDGLKLSGVRDASVLDADIARCGGGGAGSGVDLVGCHAVVIARSCFRDLSGSGVQAKGGSADVLVTRCRFEHAGERALNIGGSTGFDYFRPPLTPTSKEPAPASPAVIPTNAEARRVRVLANVIVGSRAAIAFVGATDCVAAHNTIVEPERWALRILQETTSTPAFAFDPCGGNTFASNIVVYRRALVGTGGPVNIGPHTAPESFTFQSNLWYAPDDPAASRPALPSPEAAGVAGHAPRFLDPSGGHYDVCIHSPAVGRGHAPTLAELDFTGSPFQTPPAIGAFEPPRPSAPSTLESRATAPPLEGAPCDCTERAALKQP